MADEVDIPSIERIKFFKGQRLTAADLETMQTANRELRWLHNRGLHAWGIGTGLAVTGERGATMVKIEEGYGVDGLGREIILTEAKSISVPSVSGTQSGNEVIYYLVAAYQSDDQQKVLERREGVCQPDGTVRLSEEPTIEWRRPDQLEEGIELVLGKAWIRNCKLSRQIDLSVRRYARPSEQPYIAVGQTQIGKTEWKAWTGGALTLGVTTEVDTTDADFHSTPRYVAHVAGDRYLATPQGPLRAVGFINITNATRRQFTAQVLLPQGDNFNQNWTPEIFKEDLNWHVVWMGIEG